MTVSSPPIVRRKPKRFHHDFETFSELDVTKVGSSRYARHSSTEPLMLGYAFDGGPIKQWIPVEGQLIPAEVEDAILDDEITKFAWNKPFEWNIWKHTLGYDTPHSAWRDPMVLALTCSLPGKLEKAGPIIGLGEEYLKKTGGSTLMNWFSKLRAATKTKPQRRVHWFEKYDKWLEYLEYNRFDVAAERKIWLQLSPYDLPKDEWELWFIDQEINDRGIPINMRMVENAIVLRDEIVEDRIEKMKRITGLDNPNSQPQLLGWLREQGYPFHDLKKGHVKRAIERLDDEMQGVHPGEWPMHQDYYDVLSMRVETSKTSTKKFDSLWAHTDDDGRIRNCFQFSGAQRTWRWGGRIYQPQNLAKFSKELEGIVWETTPSGAKIAVSGAQIYAAHAVETFSREMLEALYADPMNVLSGAVRPVCQAPDGYLFADADLSAIENVVLGWLADDRRILGVFEDGRDPYVDFATYLYKETYADLMAEVKSGKKGKRTVSKPGVLGCGYMLSAGHQYEDRQTGEVEATGLLGYAWNMGVKLTPEQAELSVQVWRETFKDAVQFWWDIERAAKDCIRTGKETSARHIGFDRKGPFMRMILPKGRCLHYLRPKLEDCLMPWGKWKLSITYEQLNDKHQWERINTHPGKLTENADQAVARDLLAHGIRNAHREGLDTVMHVHDQIVALVPEDDAEAKLKLLRECMTDRPSWGKGIPISVGGHLSKFFIKD